MRVILNPGRSLNLCWASEHVSAILGAWEPRMMGGEAIAEILFGKVNPSAKPPVSISRNVPLMI